MTTHRTWTMSDDEMTAWDVVLNHAITQSDIPLEVLDALMQQGATERGADKYVSCQYIWENRLRVLYLQVA